MPLKKSLKAMCVEAGIFLAVLAIATHLTVNVWEYFVLRSELSQINTTLHVLKNTLSCISSEYDKVNKELDEINAVTSEYLAINKDELDTKPLNDIRKIPKTHYT